MYILSFAKKIIIINMSATPKTKKVAKKPAAPKSHPPYADMVRRALKELKDRKGSSRQAIAKYILANYKISPNDKVELMLKRALIAGVKGGKFIHTKGTGASGSFKLTESAKKSPMKKKPAAKKPKTPKKKTAAKKKTTKKTPKKAAPAPAAGDAPAAPAVVAKPKKAKTPKKPAAKKTAVKKTTPKKVKKTPVKKTIKKKTPKKAVKKVGKK
jgi:histone H1/5